MVSDVLLVLRAEHRELAQVADQCRRATRGLQDPQAELHRRVGAHLGAFAAAGIDRSVTDADLERRLVDAGQRAREVLDDPEAADHALPEATLALVRVEESVLDSFVVRVPLTERRRMGKVFRIRRDSVLSGSAPSQRRSRSHSELYELARRAGLHHRSRMTLAELTAAVEEWERGATARRQGAIHPGGPEAAVE